MKRITVGIISIFLMLICVLPVSAQEVQVLSLGRVSVAMPQVVAEIKGNGYKAKDITAKLGTESLQVESVRVYNKTDSVCAYILVDLSTSMIRSFDLVKANINFYVDSMGDSDKVVILTFGENEVVSILDGTETKSQIKEKVNALQCNEGGTLFYEALNQAYQLSNATISEYDREYVIAFSDGIDVQRGNSTYEEMKELYGTHTLPLYAACAMNASQEASDQFGNLARASGGSIKMIQNQDGFAQFMQDINDVTLVHMKAGSNVADGEMKQLSFKVANAQVECAVPVIRALTDDEAPKATNVQYIKESNLIIIDFSEKVSGASSISAYKITTEDGSNIGIASVEVTESGTRVEIKIKDEIGNGKYRISFEDITDCSNEKNSLAASKTIEIKGIEQEKQGFPLWAIIVCSVAGILFIAGIIVLVIVLSKKKERENEQGMDSQQVMNRLIEHEGSSVIQEKHHVKAEQVQRIRLRIKTGKTSEQNIETNLVSSLIVGRSNTCDIYIDDTKLSRQHFVIESDGRNFYIMDLQSRNGTMLNGICIHGRQVLHSGDKIIAGLSDIYITILE